MTYKEIVINDFKELQALNFPEYWNFRGQSQDWKLKTCIEVLLDSLGLDYYWYIDERTNFRQEFIDKFKLATNLNNLQDSTCLALMQHYGLKTELLDVTEDINIALYFAVEDDKYKDKDGVIWAFNLVQLYKNNIENGFVINQNPPNSEYVRLDYSSKLITKMGQNSNFVMSVNLHDYQKYINKRIQNQKGRFLIAPKFFTSNSNSLWVCNNNYCGFENGLFTSYKTSRNPKLYSNINTINDDALGDKLIKFIIPKDIKRDCLLYLKNIGISKDYLFPDSSEEEKFNLICTNIKNEFNERETTVTF